jgi:hypothetical protein
LIVFGCQVDIVPDRDQGWHASFNKRLATSVFAAWPNVRLMFLQTRSGAFDGEHSSVVQLADNGTEMSQITANMAQQELLCRIRTGRKGKIISQSKNIILLHPRVWRRHNGTAKL